MVKQILIEGQTFHEPGLLTLSLEKTIEVRISAEEAERKVNQYVNVEISTQMHAAAPTFVVGDIAYWQVPVHLTLPAFGDIGEVGTLRVDSVTGVIDTSLSIIQTIQDKAEQLALRFTSPTTQRV